MDYLDKLGPLVLASRLKNLSDTLMQGVSRVYRELHVEFEPRWFPVTYYLFHIGPAQVTHLAEALRQTHPAVLQVVKIMEEKGLVKLKKDDKDQRKTIISLSSKGFEMARELEPIWEVISSAAGKLLEENFIGILENIALMEDALDSEDIYTRIKKEYVIKYLPELRIEEKIKDFEEEYKDINLQWLWETVGISDHDKKLLNNPNDLVLGKGGKIYFAYAGKEITGTVTLMPVNGSTAEITKLTVRKPYRRLGIGQKLASFAIEQAKSLGCSSILLLTHPVLKEAIDLYQKMGFVQIPSDPLLPDPTGRCSVTMKLNLHT
jgi:ribosomal protein S18 acetylase RimI-like enzyme/DNA-binding MarR family transcriptional regulator